MRFHLLRAASLSYVSTLLLRSTTAFSVSSVSTVSKRHTSTPSLASKTSTSSSGLFMVASVESPSVADMQRGMGGRIEEAFKAAKERGEAAFVTFVTAGYPTAQGTCVYVA